MKQPASFAAALVGGLVSVFTVQYGITLLWGLFGVSWGPSNLPAEPVQQTAMLITTFVAGINGPIVAILIARRIPWVVLGTMCLIGLAIDTYAALGPLSVLVFWFRVAFVLSVPLQIVVGTYLGYRLLNLEGEAGDAA